jgi:hypothetical protein
MVAETLDSIPDDISRTIFDPIVSECVVGALTDSNEITKTRL